MIEELTNLRNILTLIVTLAGASSLVYQEGQQVKEAGLSQKMMIEVVEFYRLKCEEN